MDNINFTGTQINYYFVCKRKLWLFTRAIRFEDENEYVQLGKLIDESTYKRNKKQIEIGNIKIDFIDNKGVIHEIKKSNKIEKAHIYQLKYYIYFLNKMGVKNIIGEIDYPKLKQRQKVILDAEDEMEFKAIFSDIHEILDRKKPPAIINKPYCKKCAYYEFCFV
ncbi:CRISPR-associated protein Cas4 [Desulfobacula phenolica]|uniref:CRISPR-associated exonuclease Cas4 n=1 Tax=Desulfobacula phenolica TaxID=90732 RepID=A0A1H2FG91_9BACT|nr:CRISPR-associated protein Cas4 [Desulfobacula phenolica]SDU06325.1 CRISPR-associated exonuclease Cas4 [Desulfobacula phenolica]